MKRLLRVGLTGGIGSGKSLVASVFELYRIPVYYADSRARVLMQSDSGLRSQIRSLLGDEAYVNDRLNRAFVASRVFQDEGLLQGLNALVHPAVGKDFEQWSKQVRSPHGYILKEAALIFEAGSYKELDKVIMVWAPEALRVKRVMERDQVSAEDVNARMQNQWSDDRKAKLSDVVIVNDNSAPLLRQIEDVHKLLCRADWQFNLTD